MEGLHSLQEGVCLVYAREQLFFGLEFGGVDATAAAAQLYGMLQVQHLVVDDVFEDELGDRGVIEDPADDDGVVRGIVVTEDAARLGLAPAHARAGHESVEEARVQVFEDGVKIVVVSAGTAEKFAA